MVFERGGADAVGFHRSGGFAMDSKARSGTDRFAASVEYRFQPKTLVAKNRNGEKHDTPPGLDHRDGQRTAPAAAAFLLRLLLRAGAGPG